MNLDRLASPAAKSRLVTVVQDTAKNNSGMKPIGTKILVLPDEIAEKSAGGVFLAPKTKEDHDYAIITGTVVAIGATAFTDWPVPPTEIPTVGSRVFVAKYAGILLDGDDGRRYRLVQDVEIIGMKIVASELTTVEMAQDWKHISVNMGPGDGRSASQVGANPYDIPYKE